MRPADTALTRVPPLYKNMYKFVEVRVLIYYYFTSFHTIVVPYNNN